MNPILLSPKIETDQPAGEQLRQMRSYLFQLKEQMEFLLMNIDGDNISEAYKTELSQKFADATSMSEIMQTAGMIKMTVQDVENAMASLTLTVNAIDLEVNAPTTGLSARLSVAETGVAASVKRDVSYSGFTISDSLIHIFTTGNLQIDSGNFQVDDHGNVTVIGDITANSGTFNGTVNANSGEIGGFAIASGGLQYDYPNRPSYAPLASVLGHSGSNLYIGDWMFATSIAGDTIDIEANCSPEAGHIIMDTNGVYIVSKYQIELDGILINDAMGMRISTEWKQFNTISPTDYVLTGVDIS